MIANCQTFDQTYSFADSLVRARTYSFTYSLTHLLIHCITLLTIYLKASCARCKLLIHNHLRRCLRPYACPRSDKKLPKARGILQRGARIILISLRVILKWRRSSGILRRPVKVPKEPCSSGSLRNKDQYGLSNHQHCCTPSSRTRVLSPSQTSHSRRMEL
jgi:hypothetical protein